MWFYSPTIKVRPINNVSHGMSNTSIEGTFMTVYPVGTLKDARDGGLIRLNQNGHLSFTMMTSWNENIFRVTGHCAGNSPAPGEFPTQGQWRVALMFSLICIWINGWVNNGEAGDLRPYCAHYDVTVMEDVGDIDWLAFICRAIYVYLMLENS